MEKKYGYAIVAICIVAVAIAYYQNWLADFGFPSQPSPGNLTIVPTPTPLGAVPEGTFTVKSASYNSLDISTALTYGTDVDVSYYAFRQGGWVLLGAYGATGTDVEITNVDQGYIYMMCIRHSTATYLFDAAKTLAMNTRAVSAQFIDITGDTIKEFIVKYSMFNIPSAASGYPSTTFTTYFLDDDSASASYPTGGQPADITSVGTTQTTKFLAWYMSMSAVKHGLAVYKVEVKVNTTSASKAELLNVNVPNIAVVSASSMDYQKTDSYQIWTYTIGQNLGDCTFWQLPQNANNKFDLTTSVRLTLATNDTLAWTCTVYQLSAGQTTVTDADTCITQEQA